MCGIAGTFLQNFSLKSNKRFESAINKLKHRGPNDSGVTQFLVNKAELTLGHTRLSIIDLSRNGKQPMHSSDKRYSIVFNGEVYNYLELRNELEILGYEFRTDTDTEVLLISWRQWREDCLTKLKGMFAFVIFDRTENFLFGARDAFGIKPFYYFQDEGELYFASEINALIELIPDNPSPNWQTLYNYLTNSSVWHGETSFYENIKQVLPANYFFYHLATDRSLKIKRWWIPKIDENVNLSFEDASDLLREKFLDNIKIHLRSDVSLGAALSGGVDSSAIVCAMRHLKPDMPINTFSFVDPGSVKNEEEWIDCVNDNVGAVPHKVVISADDFVRDIDQLVLSQGEPFGSTSIYAQYRVFKAARDAGIIVNMDGQGADEMLAGYSGYPQARFTSLLSNREIKLLFSLFCGLKKETGSYPIGPLLKSILQYFPFSNSSISDQDFPSLIDKSIINRKFSSELGIRSLCNFKFENEIGYKPHRSLVAELRNALTGTSGLAQLLRYEDHNSMRFSLESRVPFLTTDMVEFLLSLPENFLLSNKGETKFIFRHAMRGIVPQQILTRKEKIGFETRELEWFRSKKSIVFDWLKICHDIPLLNDSNCNFMAQEMIDGKIKFNWVLWRIINIAKWFQLNNIKI
jgi:asparagine synthase (glutamine-hydrolysing)